MPQSWAPPAWPPHPSRMADGGVWGLRTEPHLVDQPRSGGTMPPKPDPVSSRTALTSLLRPDQAPGCLPDPVLGCPPGSAPPARTPPCSSPGSAALLLSRLRARVDSEHHGPSAPHLASAPSQVSMPVAHSFPPAIATLPRVLLTASLTPQLP